MSSAISSKARSSLESVHDPSLRSGSTSDNFIAERIMFRDKFVFPFYSEMARAAKLPQAWHAFTILISVIQSVPVFLFADSVRIRGETLNSILGYFLILSDFGVSRKEYDSCALAFALYIGCFIASLAFLAYTIVKYNEKGDFALWQLYICKAILVTIYPVLIPISFSFLGKSLAEMYKTSSGSSIGFSITFLFISLFHSFSYWFSNEMDSNSAIIGKEACAQWDASFFPFIILIESGVCLFAPICDQLSSYVAPIFIILILLVSMILDYRIYFFPFVHFWVNVMFFCSGMVIIACLTLSLASCFTNVSMITTIIVLTIACIASPFIGYFLLSRRKRKIISLLTSLPCTDEENRSTTAKSDHFDSIRFSSVRDVSTFLHIGLENHCNFIIDCSFFRYLVDNYAVKEVILSVAKSVTFFPTELQLASYCISLADSQQNLTLPESFLLYQMKRINIMRQSSVSKEIINQLHHLKRMSKETIQMVRGFWREMSKANSDISFASLRHIREISIMARSSFMDALEKYQNSGALCEEYANYLIEGMGNLEDSISWHRKAILLEKGKHISTDYCFISFVNAFPSYLLEHIVDINGSFWDRNASSNSQIIDSSALLDEKDPKLKDDAIIGSVCEHGRLRLAIHNCLKGYCPKMLSVARIFHGLFFAFIILFNLSIYFIIQAFPDNFEQIYKEERNLCKIVSYVQHMGYLSSIRLSISHGVFGGISTINTMTQIPIEYLETEQSSVFNFINLSMNDSEDIIIQLNTLMSSLMSNAAQKIDIIYQLVAVTSQLFYSSDDSKNFSVKQGLADFAEDGIEVLSNSSNESKGLEKQILNSILITEMAESVFDSIGNYGEELIGELEIWRLLIALVPSIILLIFFIPGIIIDTCSLSKEQHRISAIAKKIDAQMVEESLHPILKVNCDSSIPEGKIVTPHRFNSTRVLYPLVEVSSFSVILAILVLTADILESNISSFSGSLGWLKDSYHRDLSAYRSITVICGGLLGSIDRNDALDELKEEIDLLESSHENIISSTIEFNTTLNDIHFEGSCTDNSSLTYYKLISCISLDKQVSIIHFILSLIANEYPLVNESGGMNTMEICYLIYLMDNSYSNNIINFDEALDSAVVEKLEGLASNLIPYWAVEFTVELICSMIEFYLIHLISSSYDAFNQMISFLPPEKVMKNEALMKEITHKDEAASDESITLAESIITHSSNGILILNEDMMIEMSNKALKSMTGFSSEQLLGQHISWLVPRQDAENVSEEAKASATFYQKIKNMNECAGERMFTTNLKCQTNLGSPIDVKGTIIAESGQNKATIDSYVLILRDLTEEENQKQQIKLGKNRINHLLDSLLPAPAIEIVKRNLGPAFFLSDLASVIYVEIHGLSDLILSMSPKQIMQAMNIIYTMIDQKATKYPAIHALKCYDDLYIACCGLFDFKNEPEQQADQSVCFCLDIIQGLEDVKSEVGINIELSIGVNMGGPLIGSVIDPMTPTFDMLGNVISLAMRMLSGGINGVVQVSESLASRLKPDKFDIIPGIDFHNASGKSDKSFIVKGAHESSCRAAM